MAWFFFLIQFSQIWVSIKQIDNLRDIVDKVKVLWWESVIYPIENNYTKIKTQVKFRVYNKKKKKNLNKKVN
jgi:hypothetical protein